VTKIPSEHTAARALETSFRALGQERARAPRRSRRRGLRRIPRIAVVALTALLLVTVAATGTKVFLGDGGSLDSDATGLKGHLDPAPSYRQLALASTADPVEHQPWGLRLFKSANGDTCLALGRVVDGRLGVVRQGQFQELPTRAAGMCAPLEARHIAMATRTYPSSIVAGGRVVLFGIVDRTIRRLELRSATGRTSPLSVKADGTFVVVRRGRSAFRRAQLVVEGIGPARPRAIVLDR
jgi:hypothetical protein